MTMTWQAGFADVTAARDVLRNVSAVTPVMYSAVLSAQAGGPVYLKCENLQRTGSFKLRGAYLRISRLSAGERARGVVAASAGNHAQGVALAASLLGARATVVMPAGAPLPKIAATRSYGADIVLHGTSVEDALVRAQELAREQGSVFIHPFEHPDVIAGQGTVGLEIAEQCPGVRTIVVPLGGGGLTAGIAIAARGADPAIKIVGVQAELVAPYPESLREGSPVAVTGGPTMADGIAVARPGELALGVLRDLGAEVRTVSEESLSRALLLCLERAKQVVEPAGAAGVAALLDQSSQQNQSGPEGLLEELTPPIAVVLSGGNIDPLLLTKLLRRGLSAAGRYLSFRCRLPDQPGALATMLGELAGLGANVLDVVHARFSPHLRIGEVEVSLQVETRGPGHADTVISQLRAAGYTLIFS
jgi:threonine dehydratase